jgi:hypothetical protein
MKFAGLQRNEERRKTQRSDISVETVAGLLLWREVVEPHRDVAKESLDVPGKISRARPRRHIARTAGRQQDPERTGNPDHLGRTRLPAQ